MLKRGLVILVVVLIVLAIIGLLLPRTAATLDQSAASDIEGLWAPPLGACAGERRLAQQMLGGPADTIVLDGGGEFEAHSHRLRYRG
jgi:hypothetical protein